MMTTGSHAVPAFRGIQNSDPTCPVCGDEHRAYLYVIRGLPVVRCPGCGLVSINPSPDRNDLRKFYRNLGEAVDPRLLWIDGATERDAARNYMQALARRDFQSGRILLIAPPDYEFDSYVGGGTADVDTHLTVYDLD